MIPEQDLPWYERYAPTILGLLILNWSSIIKIQSYITKITQAMTASRVNKVTTITKEYNPMDGKAAVALTQEVIALLPLVLGGLAGAAHAHKEGKGFAEVVAAFFAGATSSAQPPQN